MSEIFVVEDSKINSDRRPYKLDTDLLAGFRKAVTNNQLYLAMEYMTHIVDIIDDRLNQPQEEASLAPSRKTQKKTAESEVEA